MGCHHIVDCAGYDITYRPPVEARNPLRSYSDSATAGIAIGSKYYQQIILNECKLHSSPLDPIVEVALSNLVSVQKIKDIATAIDDELDRRGKPKYFENSGYVPSEGDLATPAIIARLNMALNDNGLGPTGGTNPSPGNIIKARTDPNPAVRRLNRLRQECVCYTDCRSYSLCSCHGHCAHY